MAQDLFKNLPSEIINDILVRLPVRSIARSKCVCKSWLELLQTDEFVKFHHSRSSQSFLAVLMHWSRGCRVYELEEEIDAKSIHDSNNLTTFDFPQGVAVLGSANGLLLLRKCNVNDDGSLYVWNPISRQYIAISCPRGFLKQPTDISHIVYGFGASKISGQYKVVRIIKKDNIHCQVYTLGTGSWRRVEAAAAAALALLNYGCCYPAAFLNGNLHWLAWDSKLICYFDLETECVSTFALSLYLTAANIGCCEKVYTLRDCICLCDQTLLRDGRVDIWLMKEYGVEKSWTKEYAIRLSDDLDLISLAGVRPIKVFQNGDILMVWGEQSLFYYSYKMKTTQLNYFKGVDGMHSLLLTPTFLSLKSFNMENVILL